MCSLWLVEALARAGEFDKSLLSKAVMILEDFIGYMNHVNLVRFYTPSSFWSERSRAD